MCVKIIKQKNFEIIVFICDKIHHCNNGHIPRTTPNHGWFLYIIQEKLPSKFEILDRKNLTTQVAK